MDELTRPYEPFIDRFSPWMARTATGDITPEEAFRVRVQLMDTWRMFPWSDADLPLELLPARRQLTKARNLFADLRTGLADRALEHVQTHAARHVPDLTPSACQRLPDGDRDGTSTRGAQGGRRAVLLAPCPPVREPFPLGPIVDGVRRLRPTPSGLGLSLLPGALRSLFPEWAGELPLALEALEDPKGTRHRLLRAMAEPIERLGVATLVIEDAHWADSATLEWLLTLCASGDQRMSIVLTYRPHDVPAGSLLWRLTSR
ncbi:PaaX family transcriptional regulator C-terminal domain-containing protein [Streptomyces sp. NPDC058293]|uniref:PaaX family transcriptional regulator C-terminal domain-containing protein n=1 Tax=Streptomyces sp. NPDC058293 TaxID=3346429 RepID=UPI0036EFC507